MIKLIIGLIIVIDIVFVLSVVILLCVSSNVWKSKIIILSILIMSGLNIIVVRFILVG